MSDTHDHTYPDVPLDPHWMESVNVRHLEKEDLPALEWGGAYTHFRRVYAQAYQRAKKGLAILWVADLPGVGLIGQVFVQLLNINRRKLADGNQRAYVHSFRVRSSYRRAGLGTKLMEVVEADLIERGFQIVTLNVGRTNKGAYHLYTRLDYRIVAPDPGRWSYIDHRGVLQHVHEPGWRMEKRLVG
jgi:ribosomal protein S18 acetylase RimI-like enzyme